MTILMKRLAITFLAPGGASSHAACPTTWAAIWLIPALGAVGVLILFLVFFREPRKTNAL